MKAIVVVVLALVFVATVLGQPQSSDTHPSHDSSHDRLVNYWTRERKENAINRDIIEREGHPSPPSAQSRDESPEEEPTIVEGYFPLARGEAPASINATNHGKRYPFPYTSGYAPSYTTNPWNLVGKVFFTQAGVDYVCSGAVLRPYVISTAGHCVYDGISGGGWSYNFIFVPGYNNGAAPYGTWSYYQLFTNTEWTTYGSFCRDFGFAVLNKNSAGQGVGNVVGYFGYLYGASTSLSWRSLGYPQAAPFNGAWDYYADSALGVLDTSCGGRCGSSCSPSTMGIGSDTTGGASGGPWIYQFGTSNYLNSLNSYKYNNQPAAIYGPYFDSYWNGILASALAVTPP